MEAQADSLREMCGGIFSKDEFMSVHEMTQLSTQVEQLMNMVDHLQSENQLLRHKIAIHIQENTRLQHRAERAATQVKQVIKQMKEQLV